MNIDWFTFAAQIINFAALVYLLNRFLYGPITGAMKQREELVASRLEQADLRQRDAKAAEGRFLELSKTLEHQRSELFEQARAESEVERKSLVEEARREIQTRRDGWRQALAREQSTLVKLVRQRAGQQVVVALRGAMSQLAGAELEEQTFAMFLRRLKELPGDEVERLKREAEKSEKIQVRTGFETDKTWQEKIRAELQRQFGFEEVTFVTVDELICGIELHVGGRKVGWSMREYLESLTDELQGMWVAD